MANLPSSKKPAIALPAKATQSQIIAAAALYLHMRAQNLKPVVLVSKDAQSVSQFKELVPQAEFVHELAEKKFVITIKKPGGEVQNVQWQQDAENLNIFITAENGELDQNNLQLKATGADYDAVLLPGVTSLTELGALADQNKRFFKDAKLFAIGSDLNLDESYDHSSSNKPNLTTLAEQVQASVEGQPLNPQVAQLLFTGILLETKNLRSEIKSSDIFLNMKKLIDRGAKTTDVERIANTAAAGANRAGGGAVGGNNTGGSSSGGSSAGNSGGSNSGGGSSSSGSTGGNSGGNNPGGSRPMSTQPKSNADTATKA